MLGMIDLLVECCAVEFRPRSLRKTLSRSGCLRT